MSRTFARAKSFDSDVSKWDVSRVKNMRGMFLGATSFSGDVSRWDVSCVNDMNGMFCEATGFTRTLCAAAWVHSKASKISMFEGSSGSISSTVCTPPQEPVTTLATQTRRILTDRELIAHMVVKTAAISTTSAGANMCPKCGTFEKSGRVSCCAPGGAWYQNCGGADNRHVDHTWIEGMEACQRKF